MKYDWQLDYDCWSCGACCRAIKCPLLIDNKCSIYEDRPPQCRIGYSRGDMSVEDYLELTKKICLELEKKYGKS